MDTLNLMTVGEVSAELRVAEKTVYRHIRDIPGGFKLFDGTWRFDRQIFMDYIRSQAKQQKARGHELSTDNRHGL